MAIQARTEFAAAINQIASEKGVDTEIIIDAIKQAALAAFRKDLSFRNEIVPDDFEELEVKINPASGEISIFRGEDNITPPGFARIAAQTAKQVITQKLHEAEKGAILEEFEQKVGTIVSGSIQRQEGNTYFVDLGRVEGVLPPQEQVKSEYYGLNQRMKFLVKELRESGRGPEVILSRTDAALVKGLFALEVPEIQSGVVEIKEIAREAGGRTKVAVVSTQDGVDPVGSLVGQKGVRVQSVINELGEEKIDIISYSDDIARFIVAALSPAKDIQIVLNEAEKIADVKIPDNQLSLAIGKGGQNVRLAAKLTGWKINIEGTGEGMEEAEKKADEAEIATNDEAEVGDNAAAPEAETPTPAAPTATDDAASTDQTVADDTTVTDPAPVVEETPAAVIEEEPQTSDATAEPEAQIEADNDVPSDVEPEAPASDAPVAEDTVAPATDATEEQTDQDQGEKTETKE